MSKLTNDSFFYSAIKSGFPHAANIRTPDLLTSGRPIFLADTRKRGTIICKFVDYNLAFRDREMSQLLKNKNISAPDITIHGYVAQWYEVYKYNPCRTLTEYLTETPTKQTLFNLYKQVLEIQAQLAESNLDEFRVKQGRYFSEVFKMTTPRSWPKILSAIYNTGINIVSRVGDVRLVHSDLKPHNILCNEDGSLNQIIDISAIAIATEEFAMISLLDGFPVPDMSEELMDYYDKITHRKLNRDFIRRGLAIVKYGRQLHNKVRQIKNIKKTKIK